MKNESLAKKCKEELWKNYWNLRKLTTSLKSFYSCQARDVSCWFEHNHGIQEPCVETLPYLIPFRSGGIFSRCHSGHGCSMRSGNAESSLRQALLGSLGPMPKARGMIWKKTWQNLANPWISGRSSCIFMDFWKSISRSVHKNTISSACSETRTQRTEGIKPHRINLQFLNSTETHSICIQSLFSPIGLTIFMAIHPEKLPIEPGLHVHQSHLRSLLFPSHLRIAADVVQSFGRMKPELLLGLATLW